jgi:hypothetical protein
MNVCVMYEVSYHPVNTRLTRRRHTTHRPRQAEARDQLAEATARAASLQEEAERLQVQEEALALQRTSNKQALGLAREEMERLREEAQALRKERVRAWVGGWAVLTPYPKPWRDGPFYFVATDCSLTHLFLPSFLPSSQDKDRALFVGEARDHAVRLEGAEAALIERERELAEAHKELAWVRVCGCVGVGVSERISLTFVYVCLATHVRYHHHHRQTPTLDDRLTSNGRGRRRPWRGWRSR